MWPSWPGSRSMIAASSAGVVRQRASTRSPSGRCVVAITHPVRHRAARRMTTAAPGGSCSQPSTPTTPLGGIDATAVRAGQASRHDRTWMKAVPRPRAAAASSTAKSSVVLPCPCGASIAQTPPGSDSTTAVTSIARPVASSGGTRPGRVNRVANGLDRCRSAMGVGDCGAAVMGGSPPGCGLVERARW